MHLKVLALIKTKVTVGKVQHTTTVLGKVQSRIPTVGIFQQGIPITPVVISAAIECA